MNALSPLQIERLKLLKNEKNGPVDIKELLVDYLSRRVVARADKNEEGNSFDESTLGQWRKQHRNYDA